MKVCGVEGRVLGVVDGWSRNCWWGKTSETVTAAGCLFTRATHAGISILNMSTEIAYGNGAIVQLLVVSAFLTLPQPWVWLQLPHFTMRMT